VITITAELLHGTIRANRADAVSGASDRLFPEWPPSPARLFAALVNGGGTGEHNRIGTNDEELHKIERATPPLIAASHSEDVPVSAIRERFVVVDAIEKNRVQEYPARTAKALRPGSRSAPRSPYITYCWPELELTNAEVSALRRRAARVGYLGSADSPVRLRINAATPRDDRSMWRPDDDGTASVSVPYPGYLGALDRAFAAFRSHASPRGVAIRRVRVSYDDPSGTMPKSTPSKVVWLSFDRSFGYRRVLQVGEALRGALLSAFEAAGFGEPPPVLHGHGVERGLQHARFLPLPNVGHEHARGQILGAAIWFPLDTDDDLFEMACVAAARIRQLRLAGGTTSAVSLRDSAAKPWTTNPQRWTRPSRVFTSAFPVVHDRFGRVNETNAAQVVGSWCSNAGLPKPLDVAIDKGPYFAKLPRLAAREVRRTASTARHPFSHVTLTFEDPLVGPLAIGRARSFGLGLLVPLDRGGAGGATSAYAPTTEVRGPS